MPGRSARLFIIRNDWCTWSAATDAQCGHRCRRIRACKTAHHLSASEAVCFPSLISHRSLHTWCFIIARATVARSCSAVHSINGLSAPKSWLSFIKAGLSGGAGLDGGYSLTGMRKHAKVDDSLLFHPNHDSFRLEKHRYSIVEQERCRVHNYRNRSCDLASRDAI